MKRNMFKLTISTGLMLLAIIFSLIAVGSIIASAHSAQSTTSATSTTSSDACQAYLQGLSQRLNLPVATLEQQIQMTKGDTLTQTPCN